MKILTWTGHDGLYHSTKDNNDHPIRDITEDDVLAIMRIILDGNESVDMDPVPSNRDNVNLAALVIYEELHKQFGTMIQQRDAVVERVDKQFEAAMSYYSDTDISDLFEVAAESNL